VTAGVGGYVTQNPPHLGNFVIAHIRSTSYGRVLILCPVGHESPRSVPPSAIITP